MDRTTVEWSGELVDLIASGARTTSGAGSTVGQVGNVKTIRAQLAVTARSGTTPTLDVVIQDTLDGTNWNTIGTFAQKTATGTEVINITIPFSNRIRVSYTVGGVTPSFTFSVSAVLDYR